MTRIDFYIVSNDSEDARLRLACRIADRAVAERQHVFINAASESEARRLDDLLWTFSDGSFLPHRIMQSDDESLSAPEPVLIGSGRPPAGPAWNVMINLAADVPEFFSRYERVAEPVDGNAIRREQSRERYRFYRDRGYPLDTHQM